MSSDRDRSVDVGGDVGAKPSGLVAGKYELLRLIGKGGMGAVWEGRHASLGTRVAIKFIEAQYANSQDARQRFDNEARAAATIESKHAIQVFDHGMMEDGRPYIVMELLVGEPLDARLQSVPRLPAQDVARIIMQVCRALSRAHEHGIIHRDLKPENIFLVRTPDDDDEIAKVLDFGIAKIRATPGAMGISSGTKTGTLLGTPFFMSPEQARGLRNVDHRSDLWALGVIVFKCLTGVLPFDGESLGDLLVKICTAPIPVPSQAAPGLTPQLDRWMHKALDREPDLRFQSAFELADALAAACGVSVRRGVPSSQTPGAPYAGSRTPGSQVPGSAAYASGRAYPTPGSAPPAPYTPATSPSPYGTPIPAATSAPFTAAAPAPTASSKNLLLGVATVCSLAAGVCAVLFLSGTFSRPKGTQETATGASPAVSASAASSGGWQPASPPGAAPASSAGLLLAPVDMQGLPRTPSSAAPPSTGAAAPASKPSKPAQPAANMAIVAKPASSHPPLPAASPAPHPVKPAQPGEQAGY